MAGYRVLIVDDHHEVRRMLAASLKSLGPALDVLEVPSGEEALLIGSGISLDLVVVDVRLPGMSGLEMVAKMQKRIPKIKTILITGVEETTTRRQVAEAGVDAFFYKPVEIADFLDAVERCLGLVKTGFPLPPVADAPLVTKATSPEGETDQPVMRGLEVKDATALQAEASPPTLGERLAALRQQVKAISAILVNDAGRVVADAGDVPEITTESPLLSALMATFSASLKVSHAMGLDLPESLLDFTGGKYHLRMAPVGPNYALLVVTPENFKVDKSGASDQSIHLAVHDLQQILESMGMDLEERQHAEAVPEPVELAAEVPVDPETLASVEALFGQASKERGKEEVDAFWDTLVEKSELDGTSNADALSYEQARRLGLTPEEEKP
jgi:CheY-like chemotaxis protein